jgi:hypothetical protein
MSRLRSRVLRAAGVASLFMTSLAIADMTAATTTTEPDSGRLRFCGPTSVRGGDTRRVSRPLDGTGRGSARRVPLRRRTVRSNGAAESGGAFGG